MRDVNTNLSLTCLSGTIIAMFLNWIFMFSGSSCRPL